jgi:hypothetical protein
MSKTITVENLSLADVRRFFAPAKRKEAVVTKATLAARAADLLALAGSRQERPLLAMKAYLFLQALGGEEVLRLNAAEDAEDWGRAEKARRDLRVLEKASSVMLEAHDRLAGYGQRGILEWFSSSGREKARARSMRLLDARGLIDYQAEKTKEALAPLVDRLDRLTAAIERGQAPRRARRAA